MRLALVLLLLAALPVRAQTDADPPAYRTASESVTDSWSEALSTLERLAASLDAFPAVPADQQADARTSLALTASYAAGGLIETTRFSLSSADQDRAAILALFEGGFDLANVLGLIAVEAANGREGGGEPDWGAHAAAVRARIEIIRPALTALGITPR